MKNIEHKNKKCGIYCIKNLINNKKYIGSSKNIYYRIARHISELLKNKHGNEYLQNSINKYGINNFTVYVIEECAEDILVFREQYYINKYSSEYNLTTKVIRNTLSKESCEKISQTLKKKYKNKEIVTYKQQHRWKTVYVYNLEGIYVNSYENCVEAAKALNISKHCVQQACLRQAGRCRAGDHQFSYQYSNSFPKLSANIRLKPITYESAKGIIYSKGLVELAKKLKVHRSSLQKAVKKGIYKGYKLYYNKPQ